MRLIGNFVERHGEIDGRKVQTYPVLQLEMSVLRGQLSESGPEGRGHLVVW
jgi:hypothetical protein